jgi:hypothetical protein
MDLRQPADDERAADAESAISLPIERQDAANARARRAPRVGDLIRVTWSIFLARFSICLAAYWGSTAASWLILLVVSLTLAGLNDLVREPAFFEFVRFLLFLADVIVPAWLQIGLNLALLKIARQEPTTIEDLFRGGPYLLTTLLASLVFLSLAAAPCGLVYLFAEALAAEHQGLLMTIAAIPMLVAARASEPVLQGALNLAVAELTPAAISSFLALGCVAALASAVVLALLARLGQYAYLVLDQGAGVLDSIIGSRKLTRGWLPTLALVYLAALAINVAGLLTFCVGLCFSLPLASLLMAVTYQALIEGLPAIARSPRRPPATAGLT